MVRQLEHPGDPIWPADPASMPALQGGVKFALEEAPTRLSFLVGLGRLAPCLKQVCNSEFASALAYLVTVGGAVSLSSARPSASGRQPPAFA